MTYIGHLWNLWFAYGLLQSIVEGLPYSIKNVTSREYLAKHLRNYCDVFGYIDKNYGEYWVLNKVQIFMFQVSQWFLTESLWNVSMSHFISIHAISSLSITGFLISSIYRVSDIFWDRHIWDTGHIWDSFFDQKTHLLIPKTTAFVDSVVNYPITNGIVVNL